MQRFLSFLQSKAVLDGKFIEMVTSSVEELTLYKLDYLYTENQSINNIYFLLDGFVSSSERIEGRDILANFWEPMTFIVPDSIVRRTYFESTGKIQLQEDSSLIKIRTSEIWNCNSLLETFFFYVKVSLSLKLLFPTGSFQLSRA